MTSQAIKRVCFLTHTQELYGANRSMLALIEGLRERGIECSVVVPEKGSMGEALAERGIPWVQMPIAWRAVPRPLTAPAFFQYWKDRIRRLRMNRWVRPGLTSWIRKQKPDLIHTNSVVLDMGIQISRALNLPHVWHLREFGDLDFDLRFDGGLAGVRTSLAASDRVVAVSRKVASHLCPQLPAEKVRVIYNGIGPRVEIERRGQHRQNRSPRNLLMVGYVQKNKGQDVALQALHQLRTRYPHLTLTFVGGGDLDWLNRETNRLKLGNLVKTVGYVKDPHPYFQDADIALVCSHAEAFGRVTAEAASHRLAIVGMSAGATPELIDHGKTGLLFDGTPSHLADCVEHLIEKPQLAEQLGTKAWELALREFCNEAYVEKVWQVYGELGTVAPREEDATRPAPNDPAPSRKT